MIKILFVFSFILIQQTYAQREVLIKTSELSQLLMANNLDLFEGATKVYNSKQKIKFARSSLLPKLNLWRLSSVLVDWKSAGEVLSQDLVPFLVPSNWQRVKEIKLLSEVTLEANHGLQKNILFQVKLMYLQLQQEIYQVKIQEEYLSKINKLISTFDNLSSINPQAKKWARDLSYKKNLIELDLLDMKKLLLEERQQLSLALGLNVEDLMMPEDLNTEVEKWTNLNDDVLLHSCELKEFDLLLKVAPKIKNELNWNILGISELSRGTAGAVFDEIPIQDGLGFGSRSTVKIHKKQVELLKRQRQGVEQTLLRQIQSINYNLEIFDQENLIALQKINFLSAEKERLKLQSSLGSNFDPMYLAEIEQKIALAQISWTTIILKIKSEQEKLRRLYEQDEYQID